MASPMDWLFPNPADQAMPYLNKIPETIKPYYEPYSQRGQRLGGQLEGQYGNLASNPGDFYNQIAGGYKESPGFQTRLKYGQNAANHAAAAGGMGGSPQHMLQSAMTAQNLSHQDFEDYLSHVLGLHKMGMEGQQGLQDQGYQAGNEYATALGSNLGNQGGLAYQGQSNQNTLLSQIIQSIIRAGGQAATGGATGGAGGGA